MFDISCLHDGDMLNIKTFTGNNSPIATAFILCKFALTLKTECLHFDIFSILVVCLYYIENTFKTRLHNVCCPASFLQRYLTALSFEVMPLKKLL